MANLLLSATKRGKLQLDIIIGISDGGLIVADLIGKAIDPQLSIPIVSLWSRRRKDRKGGVSYANFDNPYNYAIAEYLRTFQRELDRPLSVALVDHRLVTGETASRAISFLEKQVGKLNIQILFLPLMSKQPSRSSAVEGYLPYRYVNSADEKVFELTRQEYFRSLFTQALYLPYQLSAIENHRSN